MAYTNEYMSMHMPYSAIHPKAQVVHEDILVDI